MSRNGRGPNGNNKRKPTGRDSMHFNASPSAGEPRLRLSGAARRRLKRGLQPPETSWRAQDLKRQKPETFKRAQDLKREKPETFKRAQDLKRENPETFKRAQDLKRQKPEMFMRAQDLKRQKPETFKRAQDMKRQKPETFKRAQDLKRQKLETLKRAQDLNRQKLEMSLRAQDFKQPELKLNAKLASRGPDNSRQIGKVGNQVIRRSLNSKQSNPPQPTNPYNRVRGRARKPSEPKAFTVKIIDSTGELTDYEVCYIKAKIRLAMDATILKSQAEPEFLDSGLVNGSYRITCANKYSMKWLRLTVGDWARNEGATLLLVQVALDVQLTKVMVYIPGAPVDDITLFRRLERQNPSLRTDRWVVTHYQQDVDAGQTMYLSLTEECVIAMTSLNWRPYYGLSQLLFKETPRSKPRNKQAVEDTSY